MGHSDQEIAYAKINLALHVRERQADGYHNIETIFAFIDDGDLIRAKPATAISLDITGQFSAGLSASENLVLDAANLLADNFNIAGGAEIELQKNLPIASGIGGGSADAAAALRLLNRLWSINIPVSELSSLSKPLGADVPACVLSQISIGRGIGQDLQDLPDNELSNYGILLVNPLVQISTRIIFENWDQVDRGPLSNGRAVDSLYNDRNDLQPIAVSIEPVIADILDMINDTQPEIARMSGSGATCFGVYQSSDAATEAEKIIRSKQPDYWTMIGKIR